jgi:hypothetical protein
MSKSLKISATLLTILTVLSSCGAPSLDSDSHNHCIDHKFDNGDYTCSKYHLIKLDVKKNKKTDINKTQYRNSRY